jgi:hypothetical protein
MGCDWVMRPLEFLFDFIYLFVYLFIAVLGFELRVFTLSHSASPIFWEGFFKVGSGELAGFEPRSS